MKMLIQANSCSIYYYY